MQVSTILLKQQIAFCLTMLLAVPAGLAETAVHQSQATANAGAPHSRSQASSDVAARYNIASSSKSDIFPDSPGTTWAEASGHSQQTVPAQSAQTQQQTPAQQPVGTAAAPDEKAEGAPASKPAGAAIAPAKQRRIRTLSIRVALLVGAGVAIGVVTAASLSSPSRAY